MSTRPVSPEGMPAAQPADPSIRTAASIGADPTADPAQPQAAKRRPRRLGRRAKPRLGVEDVTVVDTSKVKQAIAGTMVGNFMEWFDFGVFGYMAMLLSSLFFDTGSKSLDLLLSLLAFAVSFLVRPIGGMVLGPLGDKVGRQKVLFFTMAMMAVATALIGVLPTYADIGIWAAIALYALKLVQGFSTGGEYAGATTYVAEFSPDRRRGYYSSFLDIGSYLGFAAGAATVAITHWTTSAMAGPDAMAEWGWRIPFLIAIPLGAIAILLRARIPETPAFSALDEAQIAEVHPDDVDRSALGVRKGLGGIIRWHWKELLIAIAVVAATNTAGYALTSYMPTYLGGQFDYDEMTSAAATVPSLVALSIAIPFFGHLSDKIGRRRLYIIAGIASVALMLPAFWVMRLGSFWAIQGAMFIVAIPVALWIAGSAATLPALFPTASRYGAMGLAYNVSASLFGGTTPLFSQMLVDATGNSYMPAVWIMVFGLAGLVAALCMRETANRPLLGSFPAVESVEDAEEIVAVQDEDPTIVIEEMPLPGTPAAPVEVTENAVPVAEGGPVVHPTS